MNVYYYFNKLPIYVTDNSCNPKTPTFLKNGRIWEEAKWFISSIYFLQEKGSKIHNQIECSGYWSSGWVIHSSSPNIFPILIFTRLNPIKKIEMN